MGGNAINLIYGKPAFFKLGPYKTVEGSCTDVGYTDGGIILKWNPKYDLRTVDQIMGAIQANLKDLELTIDVVLAEASTDNLRIAIGLPATAVVAGVLSLGANFGQPGSEPQYLSLYFQGAGPGGASATRHFTIQKCFSLGVVSEEMVNGKKVYKFSLQLIYDTTAPTNQEWLVMTDVSGDSTPPTVTTRTPAAGATGQLATIAPTFLFSEAIMAGDVTPNNFKLFSTVDGSVVAGSLAISADQKTVTFTPTGNLASATKYCWVACKGIRDLSGNYLAADNSNVFTTA